MSKFHSLFKNNDSNNFDDNFESDTDDLFTYSREALLEIFNNLTQTENKISKFPSVQLLKREPPLFNTPFTELEQKLFETGVNSEVKGYKKAYTGPKASRSYGAKNDYDRNAFRGKSEHSAGERYRRYEKKDDLWDSPNANSGTFSVDGSFNIQKENRPRKTRSTSPSKNRKQSKSPKRTQFEQTSQIEDLENHGLLNVKNQSHDFSRSEKFQPIITDENDFFPASAKNSNVKRTPSRSNTFPETVRSNSPGLMGTESVSQAHHTKHFVPVEKLGIASTVPMGINLATSSPLRDNLVHKSPLLAATQLFHNHSSPVGHSMLVTGEDFKLKLWEFKYLGQQGITNILVFRMNIFCNILAIHGPFSAEVMDKHYEDGHLQSLFIRRVGSINFEQIANITFRYGSHKPFSVEAEEQLHLYQQSNKFNPGFGENSSPSAGGLAAGKFGPEDHQFQQRNRFGIPLSQQDLFNSNHGMLPSSINMDNSQILHPSFGNTNVLGGYAANFHPTNTGGFENGGFDHFPNQQGFQNFNNSSVNQLGNNFMGTQRPAWGNVGMGENGLSGLQYGQSATWPMGFSNNNLFMHQQQQVLPNQQHHSTIGVLNTHNLEKNIPPSSAFIAITSSAANTAAPASVSTSTGNNWGSFESSNILEHIGIDEDDHIHGSHFSVKEHPDVGKEIMENNNESLSGEVEEQEKDTLENIQQVEEQQEQKVPPKVEPSDKKKLKKKQKEEKRLQEKLKKEEEEKKLSNKVEKNKSNYLTSDEEPILIEETVVLEEVPKKTWAKPLVSTKSKVNLKEQLLLEEKLKKEEDRLKAERAKEMLLKETLYLKEMEAVGKTSLINKTSSVWGSSNSLVSGNEFLGAGGAIPLQQIILNEEQLSKQKKKKSNFQQPEQPFNEVNNNVENFNQGKRYADISNNKTNVIASAAPPTKWSVVGKKEVNNKVGVSTVNNTSLAARVGSNIKKEGGGIKPVNANSKPMEVKDTTVKKNLSALENEELIDWCKKTLAIIKSPQFDLKTFLDLLFLNELTDELLIFQICDATLGGYNMINSKKFCEEFLKRKKMLMEGGVGGEGFGWKEVKSVGGNASNAANTAGNGMQGFASKNKFQIVSSKGKKK
ncbi:hypothetical protein HDU92_005210 [Lobulomyces angularis]|nr:hypothetical protein HDU92_005210 [Lobulomyces angularis]